MVSRASRWQSLWQRLYRGFDDLLSPWRALDERPAVALLDPSALALYGRMAKADRRHSLRLLARLQQEGYEDPDLLVAALLHDCGKAAAPLRVWHRTLKVLLRRWAPTGWEHLAAPAPPGHWRYPFFVLEHHPCLGAAWAAAAGCSPLTVWLIAHHETDPDPTDPRAALMAALQKADAAS